MVADMSAFSTFAGTAMAGGWPMARVMAGPSAVPMGHAIDLSHYFPEDGNAPHDALVVETRRHLGGCVAAIEMAFRLSMGRDGQAAAALDRLPEFVAWPMIRQRPTLLGPAVLSHMRMRAALTLMLRQTGQSDFDHSDGADGDGVLPTTDDTELGKAVSALSLAEGRWLMPGGEDDAMRADLPAEHFTELVWTVAACLTLSVRRGRDDDGVALLNAVEKAGWALLAGHDEGASPIAQAQHLVRAMGGQADDAAVMVAALDQRRFLLFAALAARYLRLSTEQVVDAMLLGPVADVAMLCRALGGSDDDFRYLLIALRPARPALTDTVVLEQAEIYGGMTDEQADAAISAMRTPPAFRLKLDHLHQVAAA